MIKKARKHVITFSAAVVVLLAIIVGIFAVGALAYWLTGLLSGPDVAGVVALIATGLAMLLGLYLLGRALEIGNGSFE